MPGETKKVVGTSHFKIGLSGLNFDHVKSVSGFDIKFDEISEHTTAAEGKPVRTRFPTGSTVWSEITIERALNDDMALWDWFKTSHVDGNWEQQMKEGTLTLYNHKMDEVLVWNLTEAWPSKYGVPALDAGGSGLATETIGVIAKFERT